MGFGNYITPAPPLPDQDRTAKSAPTSSPETSQTQLRGSMLHGVTSSCSQAQFSLLPFLQAMGHSLVVCPLSGPSVVLWQCDPEWSWTTTWLLPSTAPEHRCASVSEPNHFCSPQNCSPCQQGLTICSAVLLLQFCKMFSQDIGLPALPSTFSWGLGCYRLLLSTFRGQKDTQPAARLYRVESGQESLEQAAAKPSYFYLLPFSRALKWKRKDASNETSSSPPTSTNASVLPEHCKGKWDERKQNSKRGRQRAWSPNAPPRANSNYVPAIDPVISQSTISPTGFPPYLWLHLQNLELQEI